MLFWDLLIISYLGTLLTFHCSLEYTEYSKHLVETCTRNSVGNFRAAIPKLVSEWTDRGSHLQNCLRSCRTTNGQTTIASNPNHRMPLIRTHHRSIVTCSWLLLCYSTPLSFMDSSHPLILKWSDKFWSSGIFRKILFLMIGSWTPDLQGSPPS